MNTAPGQPVDGTYVELQSNNIGAGYDPFYAVPGTSSTGSVFNCDSSAHLISSGNYAVVASGQSNWFFNFGPPPNSGEDEIVCPVDLNGMALCNVNGAENVQYCDYGSGIGEVFEISTGLNVFPDGTACIIVGLKVEPLGC